MPGSQGAFAQASVSFAWDPSPTESVIGYRLYMGVSSRVYTNFIDCGNVTNYTVQGLPLGPTYYFTVTPYTWDGLEGDYCNEVVYDTSVLQETDMEIIVDNTSKSGMALVGSWNLSTSTAGFWADNYLHDGNTGKGSKSATFTPHLPSAGAYEVFIRYPAKASYAANVPVDVIHSGGTATKELSQKVNGDKWNSLGIFDFEAGNSGAVRIRTAGTDEHVIADAVKFVPLPEIVLDNADAEGVAYAGAWSTSTSTSGFWESDYRHDGNTQKGAKTAAFTPQLPSAGMYEVFIRYPAKATYAANVPVDILHAQGTTTVEMNQKVDGGKWNSLGTFSFDSGSAGSVQIRTSGTTEFVIVDAVKYSFRKIESSYEEIVVDNADSTGVEYAGSWSASTSTPGYWGGDYRHDENTFKDEKSVTFTPPLPSAGMYEVFVRYPAKATYAENVPVDIFHAQGTTTVEVNQKVDGGMWNSLGTFNFQAGSFGSVQIRNTGTDKHVIADAVKWVRLATAAAAALPRASSAGPTPPLLSIMRDFAGNLLLRWSTIEAMHYTVQSSSDRGVSWQPIAGFAGDGLIKTFEVKPEKESTFFRLQVVPDDAH